MLGNHIVCSLCCILDLQTLYVRLPNRPNSTCICIIISINPNDQAFCQSNSRYQLQDIIITFVVIDQIKCLRYQIKAEISRIQTIQEMLKKIEMLECYVQIEWIYELRNNFCLLFNKYYWWCVCYSINRRNKICLLLFWEEKATGYGIVVFLCGFVRTQKSRYTVYFILFDTKYNFTVYYTNYNVPFVQG